MPIAAVWGYVMWASLVPGMPPISDYNYTKDEWSKCEQVKAELMAMYPAAIIACEPTWKPEKATKPKRKKVVHQARYRTARR